MDIVKGLRGAFQSKPKHTGLPLRPENIPIPVPPPRPPATAVPDEMDLRYELVMGFINQGIFGSRAKAKERLNAISNEFETLELTPRQVEALARVADYAYREGKTAGKKIAV